MDLAGGGWGPTVVTSANAATSFLGYRVAAGPCCSQSRLDGKMGVKWPKKGAKWRLLREHATLLFMTQLLYCHVVALIVVEKSDERQIATTIYSLRTCVENMVSQIFKKAQKRSISWHITHARRTQVQIAPGGEIAALARPEADSERDQLGPQGISYGSTPGSARVRSAG